MKRIFCLLLLLPIIMIAQETIDYSRLPDKAFLHLDRNLYSQGDTVWLKAYAFHRDDHTLSNNSSALHIQMLASDGQEVGNYKMLMIDGIGYGQIPLYEGIKPGVYQLIAHTGHMKNFKLRFFHRTTIEIRAKDAQSCIKTFFDKKTYRVGDTATVTFYAYDEFHLPQGKKRFRYALLHQGETLDKGALRCFEDGSISKRIPITAGSVKYPPRLELSLYPDNDMDHLVTQHQSIPMADDDITLRFYPESGPLVSGLTCKVAFEATDAQGLPVSVKGELLEDGRSILDLNTMHQGKGVFSLQVKAANYSFRVTEPQGIRVHFPLPEVVDQGCNFSYLRQNEKSLFLIVSQNMAPEKELSLWVSQYDQLRKVYALKVGARRIFALPKAELPAGMVTFTVVDDSIPLVERLIYVDKENNEMVISTQESIYGARKKVTLSIELEEATSTAQLSLAVTDSVLGTSPWLERDNIRSYALLCSELKGPIPQINTYLEDTPQGDVYRNLLLMTHGWRQFTWINNQRQLDTMHMVNFNSIRGEVTRRKNPVAHAKMTAVVMGGGFDYAEFSTDKNGCFVLRPTFQTRQSPTILFQAKNSEDKGRVKIRLVNTDTLLFSYVKEAFGKDVLPIVQKQNLLVHEENTDVEQVPFLSYESKLLKEVVVYGEQYDPDEKLLYSEATTAFATGAKTGEDLIGGYSFADFVRQVSMRADYDPINDCIIVRNSGGLDPASMSDEAIDPEEIGAQIYVNDMPWGTDVSALDFLSKEDIIQLVVYDPRTAYATYGSEGAYGVILVKIRDIPAQERDLDRNMAIFGRFINSKDFVTQRYETQQQDSLVVVDNRITLHWEPLLVSDQNGRAEVEFYTDDISGTKQVIVQGIDDRGHLLYQTYSFEVQNVGQ